MKKVFGKEIARESKIVGFSEVYVDSFCRACSQ